MTSTRSSSSTSSPPSSRPTSPSCGRPAPGRGSRRGWLRLARPRSIAIAHNVLPHEPHPGDEALVRLASSRRVDAVLVHTPGRPRWRRPRRGPRRRRRPSAAPARGTTGGARPSTTARPGSSPSGWCGTTRASTSSSEPSPGSRRPSSPWPGRCGASAGRTSGTSRTTPHSAGRVEVHGGYVPADRLAALLARHDVLALTYRSATASQNVLLGQRPRPRRPRLRRRAFGRTGPGRGRRLAGTSGRRGRPRRRAASPRRARVCRAASGRGSDRPTCPGRGRRTSGRSRRSLGRAGRAGPGPRGRSAGSRRHEASAAVGRRLRAGTIGAFVPGGSRGSTCPGRHFPDDGPSDRRARPGTTRRTTRAESARELGLPAARDPAAGLGGARRVGRGAARPGRRGRSSLIVVESGARLPVRPLGAGGRVRPGRGRAATRPPRRRVAPSLDLGDGLDRRASPSSTRTAATPTTSTRRWARRVGAPHRGPALRHPARRRPRRPRRASRPPTCAPSSPGPPTSASSSSATSTGTSRRVLAPAASWTRRRSGRPRPAHPAAAVMSTLGHASVPPPVGPGRRPRARRRRATRSRATGTRSRATCARSPSAHSRSAAHLLPARRRCARCSAGACSSATSAPPSRAGPAAGMFFVGQLGKYLPGSVWSVLAQAEIGARLHIPRSRTAVVGLIGDRHGRGHRGVLVGLPVLPLALGAGDASAPSGSWPRSSSRSRLVVLWPRVLNAAIAPGCGCSGGTPSSTGLSGPGVAVTSAWFLLAWARRGRAGLRRRPGPRAADVDPGRPRPRQRLRVRARLLGGNVQRRSSLRASASGTASSSSSSRPSCRSRRDRGRRPGAVPRVRRRRRLGRGGLGLGSAPPPRLDPGGAGAARDSGGATTSRRWSWSWRTRSEMLISQLLRVPPRPSLCTRERPRGGRPSEGGSVMNDQRGRAARRTPQHRARMLDEEGGGRRPASSSPSSSTLSDGSDWPGCARWTSGCSAGFIADGARGCRRPDERHRHRRAGPGLQGPGPLRRLGGLPRCPR